MTMVVERQAQPWVEFVPPDEAIQEDDIKIAEMIGLSETDLAVLMETSIHHLGYISVAGTNEVAEVNRFHSGPPDTIYRGGTKFKAYAQTEAEALVKEYDAALALRRDGLDHGRAMEYKLGAAGETDYSGGKTVANINGHPGVYSDEQLIDAVRQVARLVDAAGLADPHLDGTAGDEGTNRYIGHFVDELRKRGVSHAEACITGKPDMPARGPATGRGATIIQRERMRLMGVDRLRTVTQGAGFAGLYAVAEAYDPYKESEADLPIAPAALGDLNPRTDKPAALDTDHPEGLPITQEMADAILVDPKNDRDMKAAKGYKLGALMRKIERERPDVEVRLTEGKNVLTYSRNVGPDMRLVPAATSNVFTPDILPDVAIKEIDEVGNHVFPHDVLPMLGYFGINYTSGEENNAGGTYMSTEENRRDLARIKAIEEDVPFDEPTTEEYNRRLYARMQRNERQIHHVAKELGVEQPKAVRIVALTNYAISHHMKIDESIRNIVLAA